MNKKIIIPLILLILLLAGGITYLYFNLRQQKQAAQDMEQLAALDKKEMENEYQQFANQYSEMKSQINNDSIISQLTKEQEKTQRLLQQLRETKSSDAREITRLKKELATVRAVLRSYVLEIDSLNQVNKTLTAENTRIKGQYEEANRQIAGLSNEKDNLSEKVAIAAQLDATGITMTALNKYGKNIRLLKKAQKFAVSFVLARNVTAASGMKTIYVRILTPAGGLLGNAGTFNYENRVLPCSMKRTVEYNGKETSVTLYCDIDQALQGGSFNVSIFADGNMIGSRSFSFE